MPARIADIADTALKKAVNAECVSKHARRNGMTKPGEAAIFALGGAFVVGIIGVMATAGRGPFRTFEFWGLIAGLVAWLLFRAIRYAVQKGTRRETTSKS